MTTVDTASRVPALGLRLVVLLILLIGIKPAMPDKVVLLTGPRANSYHEMGERLAEDLRRRGLEVEVKTTGADRKPVGKELTRDARYLGMASRVCAENGATFVKTYYCSEGFEKVTAACPVPIVIAGGKKIDEREAVQLASNAIRDGASGVDMGRNIFQSDSPEAMIQAVRAVVHDVLRHLGTRADFIRTPPAGNGIASGEIQFGTLRVAPGDADVADPEIRLGCTRFVDEEDAVAVGDEPCQRRTGGACSDDCDDEDGGCAHDRILIPAAT